MMNTWFKLLSMMIIVSVALLFSCNGGKVEQLKEVKEAAEEKTGAISGDMIKTAEKAAGQEGEEEPSDEEPTPPVEEEEEDDGDIGLPVERPPFPPVEPIDGNITIADLVYPIYNPATGSYERPRVGDVPSYTSMTTDPFHLVMGYYKQLLSGRKYDSKDNIGQTGVPLYANFVVEDGGDIFTIILNEDVPGGSTIITLMKS